jgi:isoleucyl-tRNA synthetase
MILFTLLGYKSPFKNLIVNGLILAEDGKKISKRLQNHTSPEVIIERESANGLRLYPVNSPTVRAEPMRFRDADVRKIASTFLMPWFNSINFFVQR